jgi:hypothetical protein
MSVKMILTKGSIFNYYHIYRNKKFFQFFKNNNLIFYFISMIILYYLSYVMNDEIPLSLSGHH